MIHNSKVLFAIVLSVLAFASCKKENLVSSKPEETVTLSFCTNKNVPLGGDTKTILQADNSVVWDYVERFDILQKTTDNEDKDWFLSKESDFFSSEGEIAHFSVNFPAKEGVKFTYYALYPNGLIIYDPITTYSNDITLKTATNQSPSLSSFDGKADMLISKPVLFNEQPVYSDEISLVFKRLVAVGKMTLSNLNTSGDPVLSVRFSAPGKRLSGEMRVNFDTGVVNEYGSGAEDKNYVLLNYKASTNFTSGSSAFFTCLPASLTAGDTFTVIAETATARYTKEVTIPSERTLEFKAGAISTFNVDMSSATVKSTVIPDGDYVIVATDGAVAPNYFALTNQITGAPVHLSSKTLEDFSSSTTTYSTDLDFLVWTITKSGDYYHIQSKDSGSYLKWQGGSTTGANVGSDPYDLAIEECFGTYKIYVPSNTSRVLSRDSGSARFAFFTEEEYQDLNIVPVVDPRTPMAAPTNVVATVDEGTPNTIIVSWNAVVGANNYTVSISPNHASSITTSGTSAAFEGLTYGTEYTISVVANPFYDEYYLPSAAATSNSVVVNPYFVRVETTLADWSGQYLIVCETANVAFDSSLPTLNVENNCFNVSISNQRIEATAAVKAKALSFAPIELGTSFMAANGSYVYGIALITGLYQGNSAYANVISIDNNDFSATISCVTSYLRYDPAHGQFLYYSGTAMNDKELVHLYKLNQ